jgi:hypothetical protein
VKRSRIGAQRNLRVYGKPTRVKRPMVERSTPSSFIQAWRTERVSRSGTPQENPIRKETSIRGEKMRLSIKDFIVRIVKFYPTVSE